MYGSPFRTEATVGRPRRNDDNRLLDVKLLRHAIQQLSTCDDTARLSHERTLCRALENITADQLKRHTLADERRELRSLHRKVLRMANLGYRNEHIAKTMHLSVDDVRELRKEEPC
jgi:DNA-binding NarL/FixJ family response regulator